MIGLFCSTSLLSEVTGGGKVSIHEFNALKEVCEEIDYFHRGSLEGNHPLDVLVASVISREYDIAYVNGGPWRETVAKVKSLNPDAKIVSGVPAHNIELSIEAHTSLGVDYGKFYPHMVDPKLLKKHIEHIIKSDLVVYSSNQAKEYFTERFNMTNEGVVIYHGCDIPEEVSFPSETKFDVGYIGAWGPDKGVRYLIDAWSRLDYDDSTLIFFGSGSKQNKAWLESVATAGRYHLYGKYEDLPEIMHKFHLGVFPTVTEGFNLGALECMVYGKPVVVTEGAGVSEIVADGVEGCVLPIRDSVRIGEVIDYYKRNPQELTRHGAAAREKAQKYNWDEVEEQYVNLFQRLLKKPTLGVYDDFMKYYLSVYVDADIDYLARYFDESLDSKIIEIGANQEPVSNILSLIGYDVVGVDLMDYSDEKRGGFGANFRFIKGDFNEIVFDEKFDVVISTSALEHFGLGAYGEAPYSRDDGDILAMKKCWDILEEGGHAYITVPVGVYELNWQGWRVYDKKALDERIIQNFKVLKRMYFASGLVEGYKIGDELDEETAFSLIGPEGTVLLILEKRT